jgi:hypothetical protein
MLIGSLTPPCKVSVYCGSSFQMGMTRTVLEAGLAPAKFIISSNLSAAGGPK